MGHEFWTTDGTIAGTTLVADLEPNGSSGAAIWGRFNGKSIVTYVVDTTLHAATLSDDGVVEVLAQAPSSDGMFTVSTALPDRVLIASASKLYSSDGTSAGTIEIALPQGFSVELRNSAVFDGSLYLGLTGEGFGVAKYDISTGVVSGVTNSRQYQAYGFRATNDGVYWHETPGLFREILFTSDGVNAEVLDFGNEIYVHPLDTINGNLVFVGINGDGVALRGATSNTIINLSPNDPGPTSDSVTGSNTVQLNGLQFVGVYLNSGFEFWRTDGTEAGTIQLTPNNFGFSPLSLVTTASKVFAVGQGPTGVELWTSDGTVAGTTFVTTLDFLPDWIVAYQDQAVVAGNGGLWASDGSFGDLRLLANVEGTVQQSPAVWGDAIYFNASLDGSVGVWKFQSVTEPTLSSLPSGNGYPIVNTVVNGDLIAFTTFSTIPGYIHDLWTTSDGFETWNFVASNVYHFEFVGGVLYYNQWDSTGSSHIMRSDLGNSGVSVDLGAYRDSVLFEIDEVLYAKILKPEGYTWQVLSATGPHGALEPAADLSAFDDLISLWQIENLNGKAIGPINFPSYGLELGITTPETRVVLANSLIIENSSPQSVVGAIDTAWTDAGYGLATYSLVAGNGDDSNDLFTIDANGNLVSVNSLDFEVQGSYSLRIRADYSGGQSVENSVTVFVQNQVESLERLDLDGRTVKENAAPGTVVGQFSLPSAQPGESFTYQVISVDGNVENLSFRVEGDLLVTNAALDFETSATPIVEVLVTSSVGESAVHALTLSVLDVNENSSAPIHLTNDSLFEDNSDTVMIGDLSVPGSTDNFVFNLNPTGQDSSLFSIVGNTLYFNGYADFEVRDNYSIQVIANNGTQDINAHLTIDILPVDEFPISGLWFTSGNTADSLPFFSKTAPLGNQRLALQ